MKYRHDEIIDVGLHRFYLIPTNRQRAIQWISGLVLLLAVYSSQADTLRIASASSLSEAMTDIAHRFEQNTDHKIKLSFASSSALARQIRYGAPFQVFLSANRQWLDYVSTQEHNASPERIFATNRLVLATQNTSSAHQSWQLDNKQDTQRWSHVFKHYQPVAIADPVAVPLGQYTKEVLNNLGQWHSHQKTWVISRSARANLALLESNAVTLGFVYESDLSQSNSLVALKVFDTALHSPMDYHAINLTQDSQASEEFLRYLLSPEAQKILSSYGFSLPETP